MFTNLLRFWAKYIPGAPAFVLTSGSISYSEFYRTVCQFAAAFSGWPVPIGSVVLISDSRPFIHWCELIALEHLGYATVSSDDQGYAHASPHVAAVVAESAAGAGASAVAIVTDRVWLDRVVSSNAVDLPVLRPSADQPVRLVLSSGTTGKPKAVMLSRRLIEARLSRPFRDPGAARPYVSMGLNTAGGYGAPLATWRIGGAVVFGGPGGTSEAVQKLEPNYLVQSPGQLQQLLTDLPAWFSRTVPMTIALAGGQLPASVAEEAKVRLKAQIEVIYGSTESGTVSMGLRQQVGLTPGAVGWVVPWVEFEIVNDADEPVAPNAVGEIRVRGDDIVQSYWHDEEGSRRMFRNGWFYPGDLARMDDGLLIIVGRVDEVLNLGGVKIASFALEEKLRTIAGMVDVAVVMVARPDGQSEPVAAVVLSASANFKTVAEAVKRMGSPDLQCVQLERLPRGQGMGKVQLPELRRQLQVMSQAT